MNSNSVHNKALLQWIFFVEMVVNHSMNECSYLPICFAKLGFIQVDIIVLLRVRFISFCFARVCNGYTCSLFRKRFPFLVSQEVALVAFLQRYRPSVDSFQRIVYLFYLWLNFNCSSADYSMSGDIEG